MPKEQVVAQNISLYPSDRVIVEAVMRRNGMTFSNAVRFILREWARLSDPDNIIQTSQPSTRKSGKIRIEKIPGITKGMPAKIEAA